MREVITAEFIASRRAQQSCVAWFRSNKEVIQSKEGVSIEWPHQKEDFGEPGDTQSSCLLFFKVGDDAC